MSLSAITDSPPIRDAYKKLALPTRKINSILPFNIKDIPVQVYSEGELQSSVATSFSYMARFKIAREILMNKEMSIAISDTGWICEMALQQMQDNPIYENHQARWFNIVNKARQLFDDYINGVDVDINRIAICCQYLANADLLYRIGEFNPFFKHKESVQRELVSLYTVFDPLEVFKPKLTCDLNPKFKSGSTVGGVDADLMIDQSIIDFKTTADITISAAQLRSLAGYAALCAHGGIEKPDSETDSSSCKEIGLYFSRHAKLVKIRLDQLFPDNGFDDFCSEIYEQIPDLSKKESNLYLDVSF